MRALNKLSKRPVSISLRCSRSLQEQRLQELFIPDQEFEVGFTAILVTGAGCFTLTAAHLIISVFSRIVLIFQDAITLEMIRQNHDRLIPHSTDTSTLIHRVVFIDSTWQQCHQIITVSTFMTMPFILMLRFHTPVFKCNFTMFWIPY